MLRQFILTILFKGVSAAGIILLNVYIGRVFGLEFYGQFSSVLILTAGFSILVRYGADTYVLRYLSIAMLDKRDFTGQVLEIYLWVIPLSLVGSFFSCFFLGVGGIELQYSIYLLFFTVYSLSFVNASLLRAIGRPEVAPFFEFGVVGVVSSFFYIQFYSRNESGLNGLLFAVGLFGLCSLVLLYFNIKHYLVNVKCPAPCLNVRKRGSFFVSSVSMYLMQWVAPVFIMYFTVINVGVYNAAYNVSLVISFSLLALNGAVAPRISRMYEENDMSGLSHLFKISTALGFFVSLPVFLVIYSFPEFILSSTYGEEYLEAEKILKIMSVAQLMNVMFGPVGLCLSMMSLEYIYRNILLVISFLLVVLGYPVINEFGMVGASFLLLFSLLTQNIMCAFFLYVKTSLRLI